MFETQLKRNVAEFYYQRAIVRRLLARVDEYLLQNKIWLRDDKLVPPRRGNKHHPYQGALAGYRREIQYHWNYLEGQYKNLLDLKYDTYDRRIILDVL